MSSGSPYRKRKRIGDPQTEEKEQKEKVEKQSDENSPGNKNHKRNFGEEILFFFPSGKKEATKVTTTSLISLSSSSSSSLSQRSTDSVIAVENSNNKQKISSIKKSEAEPTHSDSLLRKVEKEKCSLENGSSITARNEGGGGKAKTENAAKVFFSSKSKASATKTKKTQEVGGQQQIKKKNGATDQQKLNSSSSSPHEKHHNKEHESYETSNTLVEAITTTRSCLEEEEKQMQEEEKEEAKTKNCLGGGEHLLQNSVIQEDEVLLFDDVNSENDDDDDDDIEDLEHIPSSTFHSKQSAVRLTTGGAATKREGDENAKGEDDSVRKKLIFSLPTATEVFDSNQQEEGAIPLSSTSPCHIKKTSSSISPMKAASGEKPTPVEECEQTRSLRMMEWRASEQNFSFFGEAGTTHMNLTQFIAAPLGTQSFDEQAKKRPRMCHLDLGGTSGSGVGEKLIHGEPSRNNLSHHHGPSQQQEQDVIHKGGNRVVLESNSNENPSSSTPLDQVVEKELEMIEKEEDGSKNQEQEKLEERETSTKKEKAFQKEVTPEMHRSPSRKKNGMMMDEFQLQYFPFSNYSDAPWTLEEWGLPPPLCQAYESICGIKKLYPWQRACLCDYYHGLATSQGQQTNLLYSAPTSGGKTLVSEIIMWRTVLGCCEFPAAIIARRKNNEKESGKESISRGSSLPQQSSLMMSENSSNVSQHVPPATVVGKKAIFVVPYVAVAEEKTQTFQLLAQSINKNVKCHAGHKGNSRALAGDVLVCTMEKANILLNIFVERDRLVEVGIVIVDELHQLADPGRGYVLELLLTKLVNYSVASEDEKKKKVQSSKREEEENDDKTTARQQPPSGPNRSGSISKKETPQKTLTGGSSSVVAVGSTQQTTTQTQAASPIPSISLVGMSATLSNAPQVANWLRDASVFITDYRPVPLQEYYVLNANVCDAKGNVVRRLGGPAPSGKSLPSKPYGGQQSTDATDLLHLVKEGLTQGFQTLVFCASRKMCELSASYIHQEVEALFANSKKKGGGEVSQIMNDSVRKGGGTTTMFSPHRQQEFLSPAGVHPIILANQEGVGQLIRQLKSCVPAGTTDQGLEKVLQCGIAYHHAALTGDEKTHLEAGFRAGTIWVLCCTTTLATGVNLPARRVIFRTPKIGIQNLDVTRYRQASGRAGRTGLDPYGESFLIGRSYEQPLLRSLLSSVLPPLESNFSIDKRGMMRVLLDAICSKKIQTVYDIQQHIMGTLLASLVSYEKVHLATKQALEFLESNEFIEWDLQAEKYLDTPLGKATINSSLAPDEALLLYEELNFSKDHFIMSDDLHLIFHCTPPNHGLEPDWTLFHDLVYGGGAAPCDVTRTTGGGGRQALSRAAMQVVELLRIDQGFLMNSMSAPPNRETKSARLLLHRRFYAAMILYDAVREMPLQDIGKKYNILRGEVHRLMETAATFAGMVSTFCDELNWWFFPPLLDKMAARLNRGVELDLVPLMKIPNLVPWRARDLFRKGYRTVLSVASATAQELEKVLSSERGGGRQFRQQFAAHKGGGASEKQYVNDDSNQVTSAGQPSFFYQDIKSYVRMIQRGATQALAEEASELSSSIEELKSVFFVSSSSTKNPFATTMTTANKKHFHDHDSKKAENLFGWNQQQGGSGDKLLHSSSMLLNAQQQGQIGIRQVVESNNSDPPSHHQEAAVVVDVGGGKKSNTGMVDQSNAVTAIGNTQQRRLRLKGPLPSSKKNSMELLTTSCSVLEPIAAMNAPSFEKAQPAITLTLPQSIELHEHDRVESVPGGSNRSVVPLPLLNNSKNLSFPHCPAGSKKQSALSAFSPALQKKLQCQLGELESANIILTCPSSSQQEPNLQRFERGGRDPNKTEGGKNIHMAILSSTSTTTSCQQSSVVSQHFHTLSQHTTEILQMCLNNLKEPTSYYSSAAGSSMAVQKSTSSSLPQGRMKCHIIDYTNEKHWEFFLKELSKYCPVELFDSEKNKNVSDEAAEREGNDREKVHQETLEEKEQAVEGEVGKEKDVSMTNHSPTSCLMSLQFLPIFEATKSNTTTTTTMTSLTATNKNSKHHTLSLIIGLDHNTVFYLTEGKEEELSGKGGQKPALLAQLMYANRTIVSNNNQNQGTSSIPSPGKKPHHQRLMNFLFSEIFPSTKIQKCIHNTKSTLLFLVQQGYCSSLEDLGLMNLECVADPLIADWMIHPEDRAGGRTTEMETMLKDYGISSSSSISGIVDVAATTATTILGQASGIDVLVLGKSVSVDGHQHQHDLLQQQKRKSAKSSKKHSSSSSSGIELIMSPSREVACINACGLVKLMRVLLGKLLQLQILQPFLFLEMPMIASLVHMETCGIGFSSENYHMYRLKMEEKTRWITRQCYDISGQSNWKLSSPKDCARILFDVLKLPSLENCTDTKYFPRKRKRTKLLNENRSTKASVLKQLTKMFPEQKLPALIREFRTLFGWNEKYIQPLCNAARKMTREEGKICYQDFFHDDNDTTLPLHTSDGHRKKLASPPSFHKIFGEFLHTATATGRLAMNEPNLQTIPHPITFSLGESEDVELCLRRAFVPFSQVYHQSPKKIRTNREEIKDPQSHQGEKERGGGGGRDVDGTKQTENEMSTLEVMENENSGSSLEGEYLLLSADYAQIEMRLLTHFSQDPVLITAFQAGGDIFKSLALKLFHKKSVDAVTAEERKYCKTLCYGMIYGKGKGSIAEELEISEEEAEKILTNFRATYASAWQYLAKVQQECAANGFVETIAGRKRWLSFINSHNSRAKSASERMAVNTLCQGSAADIVKQAMITVLRFLAISAKMHQEKMKQKKFDEDEDRGQEGENAAGGGGGGLDKRNFSSTLEEEIPSLQVDDDDDVGTLAWHQRHVFPAGSVRLLLQIHDELLFEVKRGYENSLAKLVTYCMTRAVLPSYVHVLGAGHNPQNVANHPQRPLSERNDFHLGTSLRNVDLPVKIRVGKNWNDLVSF